MSGPNIRFSQVSLTLSGAPILEDINETIQSGSIHCVIGPNGGGKTSLIRCLLGEMPHTGSIEIDWKDSTTLGYVPQFLDFDKTLPVTVENFLAMIVTSRRPAFLRMRKPTRTLAEQLLEKVGLPPEKLTTRLGSLSGGERQRVLFGQALLPSPALLVLDEPMTSMDAAGAENFLRLIRELADGGTTVVWIAHELDQVKAMADHVTSIGRTVLASGRPSEVLAEGAPDSPGTLGSMP